MYKSTLTSFLLLLIFIGALAENPDPKVTFVNPARHEVVEIEAPRFKRNPKNIILIIGDGMGTSHVFAALTANGGMLNLNHMKHIGFLKTHSADDYVTDSAAGGTALATGQKVNNGMLSLTPDGEPIPTFLQISSQRGKATGMVVTSSVTHATPASFIAHQPSRDMHAEIAADFLETDIDLFIGGGLRYFNKRSDGRDLVSELEGKGYKVFTSMSSSASNQHLPVAVLTAEHHPPIFNERGDLLTDGTRKAIDLLSRDRDGFFLMVEGSQIDWGGHANNTTYIVGEMLDMDRALGVALEFAVRDRETLVILASDHETGGMSINDGCFNTNSVTARYTTTDHTGVMVPIFAFGPGAENFLGIHDNTELFNIMMSLFRFKR